MIWTIIFLVFAIVVYALTIICAHDDDRVLIMIGGLAKVTMVLLLVSLIESKHPKPSAIDVYRDKTTLEITYRDSVAVDSVVVYKMK